jgi:hypothetical protein
MMLDQDREIARRAYAIWEIEGRPTGRELDHWLRAESEVQAQEAAPVQKTPPARAKPRRTPARRIARRME